MGKRPHFEIAGDGYPTPDGTCVRDYIHVADLISAHMKALAAFNAGEVGQFNVGLGKGSSVREFAEACKKVTGVCINFYFIYFYVYWEGKV
jgi:UDP-arabinose 4-epimerase